MLKVEEFEDKLVITENSSKIWIFVVLLFFLFWMWGYFGFDRFIILSVGVLSIVFVILSLLVITNNEININNKDRELTIKRNSFFSFNSENRVYKFESLAETLEFEKRSVGRSENYFAYVKTINDKKIDLFDLSTSEEDKFFSLLKLSNKHFIGLSDKDFQLTII